MDARKMGGQFSEQGVSSADIERGFIADSGDIPDDGENVFHPQSGERKRMMMEYMPADEHSGGFLGRSDCPTERY